MALQLVDIRTYNCNYFMKTVDVIIEDKKTVYLIISYKFKGFKNIIVSGKKIYQLPCQIGMRAYELKEIICKKGFYLIESKRYSIKQLKKLIYKRKDKYLLNEIFLYPF